MKDKCCCHTWLGPVLLLVIGILWLLTDLGVFYIGISWWPIVFIALGILKLFHGEKLCK